MSDTDSGEFDIMGSEAPAADMYKCPVCNGNVKTGPDDVVITCTYCGSTTTIEGKAIGDHLMEPAVDSDERLKGFQAFLDANKGMNNSLVKDAQVVENRLIYVPIWTSRVKADSYYKGYKIVQVPVQKTRRVRDKDGNWRTETYTDYEKGYVPIQDEIHTNTNERLLARKGARFYGLEDYLSKVSLDKTVPYDFEKIKDLEPDVLNAEIGQEEAEKALHSRVADRHRAQANGALAELFDCRTQTDVQNTTYLQAPFSLIRYKFQGDLYKAAIDGNSGKVVLGEIPITKGQRIVWTVVGLIGIILSALGGQIAFMGYESLGTENELILYLLGGIGAVIIAIVMVFYGFRVLFMTQRTKKG
jgi:hypothetical protein